MGDFRISGQQKTEISTVCSWSCLEKGEEKKAHSSSTDSIFCKLKDYISSTYHKALSES